MATLTPKTITASYKGYPVQFDVGLEEGERFSEVIDSVIASLEKRGFTAPAPPKKQWGKGKNGERTYKIAGYVLNHPIRPTVRDADCGVWLFAAGEKMKYKVVRVPFAEFGKLPFEVNQALNFKGRKAPEKAFAQNGGFFNEVKPFKAVVKTVEDRGMKFKKLVRCF